VRVVEEPRARDAPRDVAERVGMGICGRIGDERDEIRGAHAKRF
jgi:hypothetical protein